MCKKCTIYKKCCPTISSQTKNRVLANQKELKVHSSALSLNSKNARQTTPMVARNLCTDRTTQISWSTQTTSLTASLSFWQCPTYDRFHPIPPVSKWLLVFQNSMKHLTILEHGSRHSSMLHRAWASHILKSWTSNQSGLVKSHVKTIHSVRVSDPNLPSIWLVLWWENATLHQNGWKHSFQKIG